MLAHGLIIAAIVTTAWILLQVASLRLFKSPPHFESMALGYLLSLPFLYLAWRHLPVPICPCLAVSPGESPALGLFHAYLFHALLFALYFQCFKHLSRSVTLRLLEELEAAPGHRGTLAMLQESYSVDDMVRSRVAHLEEKGYLVPSGDSWRLTPKAKFFARLTGANAALFRSVGQMERGD